jgi:predicted acetyltransferase
VSADQAVTLRRASRADAALLENLLSLYVHDMGEIFPVELGADGRYAYPKLPLYWQQPDTRHAFVILHGDRVAGCALATRGSPASDDPDVLDVAEFFVLRAHRRAAVGRRAAFALWDTLPGRWIVRVSEGNRAGLPFWRATIAAYASGAFVERARAGEPHSWRDFTFASRDGASPRA